MYHTFLTSAPRVSIVTIVLNGARYIEQAINSVLQQTVRPAEYIIIDGGSTDGTVDIIRKYEQQITCFVSEPDEGISDAFNKGILSATGDIIGMLNGDDWYEPDAVSNVLAEFVRYPYIDVFYGKCAIYGEGGSMRVLPVGNTHVVLNQQMSIAHPAVFVTQKAYIKYGLFDKAYKIAMDYDWLLRSYVFGGLFHFMDCRLSHHRQGGISQQQYSKGREEQGEIRKKYLGK